MFYESYLSDSLDRKLKFPVSLESENIGIISEFNSRVYNEMSFGLETISKLMDKNISYESKRFYLKSAGFKDDTVLSDLSLESEGEGVIENFKTILSKIWQFIKNVFVKLYEMMSSFFSKVFQWVKNSFYAIINGLKNIDEKGVEYASKVIDKIDAGDCIDTILKEGVKVKEISQESVTIPSDPKIGSINPKMIDEAEALFFGLKKVLEDANILRMANFRKQFIGLSNLDKIVGVLDYKVSEIIKSGTILIGSTRSGYNASPAAVEALWNICIYLQVVRNEWEAFFTGKHSKQFYTSLYRNINFTSPGVLTPNVALYNNIINNLTSNFPVYINLHNYRNFILTGAGAPITHANIVSYFLGMDTLNFEIYSGNNVNLFPELLTDSYNLYNKINSLIANQNNRTSIESLSKAEFINSINHQLISLSKTGDFSRDLMKDLSTLESVNKSLKGLKTMINGGKLTSSFNLTEVPKLIGMGYANDTNAVARGNQLLVDIPKAVKIVADLVNTCFKILVEDIRSIEWINERTYKLGLDISKVTKQLMKVSRPPY